MFQANPYAIPLFIGLIPVLSFALVAWRQRANQSARFFLLYALASAAFMFTYAMELLSARLPLMMLWLKLEYVSVLSVPVIWLLFILSYFGYDDWITRRRILLLSLVPAVHLLLVWTNEYHGLNWRTTGTQVVNSMVLFDRTYGAALYIGTVYLYLIALAATIITVISFMRAPERYRGQIALLLLPVGFIWSGNVLTLLDLTLVPKLDLTPFGYALAAIPMAWSLFHYHLFDLMPAAHRQVFKGMSDAVIVMDAQDRLIEANPAATQLLRLNSTKAIGRPLAELLPDTPELIERFRSVTETRADLHFGEGDNARAFDLNISPLRDKQGLLTGRVVVLRDVSHLKRAEALIRQYAVELEERNSQLDAFGHTIAHDLKAPLSAVIGYSDMLMMFEGEWLSPQAKDYVRNIQQSAQKMERMVTELLQFASLHDIGGVVTQVDMNQVVKAASERFKIDIERRCVRLDIPPDLPPALGHAQWLEEVFANLISNAVKYIGKDNHSPCIAVRGSRQGAFVRYEVQDNGLGIEPENQKQLFEMFARFHKGEASGLGLGLSIVLQIVKRLGGRVGVDSEPGKGSTFWFTLPAAPQPDPAPLPVAV
ncbi:MAG: PAS domain-containing protein [Chloroflexi bacterium]|nr:PAS domain-containing protein [Chloroflexota bacterium]